MSDRKVHADLGDAEIVRYDRAGKWYWESKTTDRPRRLLDLNEAVELVTELNQWKSGRSGGRAFDRRVAEKFDPQGRL